MVRELAISLYLLFFKTIFIVCKLFPQKNKTTLVSSFGDNVLYTAESLEKWNTGEIIILKTPSCREDFSSIQSKVIPFSLVNFSAYVKGIYHLATSRIVMVDNYFGFLAVTDFNENVECIQLWHAAGALKKFGLMDPSAKLRTSRAQERFKKVYSKFSYVTVGSEKMATIFKESFGLSNTNILRTGVPRTDFFFNQDNIAVCEASLLEQYPVLKKRKVIMYAPTYRDDELDKPKIALDIERLYRELGQEYVLFLRLHPAVSWDLANVYPNFVIDVTHHKNINPLLLVTDILITDYSSIPFEYSLLNRPIIFFTYDLEDYQRKRGVPDEYLESLPGPMVRDTKAIIKTIKKNDFYLEKVQAFAKQWNQYSNGHASDQLVQAMYSSHTAVAATVKPSAQTTR
ncbi:CDP-glycerol glycerophosphotransferase family protein [Terribacillus sp. DMT04]|uniref:CDP-glycerol glycerophosphotransferase family protein n=1 Tax=Terribacillus sp. DMT04 TaxID=2850441 RepID=UPI001C2C165B|nr:CDP-glycerol glycerophosphotransferase family protein [Terribacillus sp. DMT04]QXE01110.1 CDP-glycerol glycerophosphotransferase family protein [Terribacillus sp. DMT04]